MIRWIQKEDQAAWEALTLATPPMHAPFTTASGAELTALIGTLITRAQALCRLGADGEVLGIAAFSRGRNAIDWIGVAKHPDRHEIGSDLLRYSLHQLDSWSTVKASIVTLEPSLHQPLSQLCQDLAFSPPDAKGRSVLTRSSAPLHVQDEDILTLDMGALRIVPMEHSFVQSIVQWTYDGPYAFYDLPDTDECASELLGGSYWAAVHPRAGLVGFFCTGASAHISAQGSSPYGEEALDFGLGMLPLFAGKGLGTEFIGAGLSFLKSHFAPTKVRLTVASWNTRALLVYRRLGFAWQATVFQSGTDTAFDIMTLHV